MTSCATPLKHPGLAFDTIAEQYDDVFTRSLLGRAQRDAVWHVLKQTFQAGDRVLELNCGTGEDALFLAQMGVSVFACDISEKMIAVAARRMAKEARGAEVQLEVRPTEQIGGLRGVGPFDGAFSNFSGLNCVADLAETARQLAALVKPRGQLVLCLSTRFCLWETLWFLAHRDLTRAARRWRGKTVASVGSIALAIQYPTMRDMRSLFAPAFSLRSYQGIGVAVPPSFVEHLAVKYPRVVKGLQAIDRTVATWPAYRVIGDHMLLVLERTTA